MIDLYAPPFFLQWLLFLTQFATFLTTFYSCFPNIWNYLLQSQEE